MAPSFVPDPQWHHVLNLLQLQLKPTAAEAHIRGVTFYSKFEISL